jgi:hypothetical protein
MVWLSDLADFVRSPFIFGHVSFTAALAEENAMRRVKGKINTKHQCVRSMLLSSCHLPSVQ